MKENIKIGKKKEREYIILIMEIDTKESPIMIYFEGQQKEKENIFIKMEIYRYEGQFKEWDKNGKGIYFYKSGDIHEGDFKNNKKNGKGILY